MSPYFIMVLLSFAVSFDSFFFGFTFQLRSIQLSLRFVWLIGLVTGSCLSSEVGWKSTFYICFHFHLNTLVG